MENNVKKLMNNTRKNYETTKGNKVFGYGSTYKNYIIF